LADFPLQLGVQEEVGFVSIDASIAELAREQHGLITVDQMRSLGGTRRHLDRRVQGGWLEQVNHRVFRIGGHPRTWESRVLGAVLGAGPDAVASHLTAAALWGLDGFSRRGAVELSVPRGRHHRPDDARCHESTDLDRCKVIARCGIPTTDLPRTLLDLGRFVGAQRLNRVVEDARRSHGLDLTALISTLARHARQGRHGIQRLRAVIDAHADRDQITDSEFEMLVLSLLGERGLPAPTIHHEVWSGGVLVAEIDLAWPHRHVGVELQGQHHRVDSAVWEADQVKLVELQALGWTILPFSWRVYMNRREWMLRRIRGAVMG